MCIHTHIYGGGIDLNLLPFIGLDKYKCCIHFDSHLINYYMFNKYSVNNLMVQINVLINFSHFLHFTTIELAEIK